MMNDISRGRLTGIIDKFKGKKVLVIGDIMLDKSIKGDVSRISPEAPVQVVNVEREYYVPGGAANVAANIVSLSGKVDIVGSVGMDEMSKILVCELKKSNIGIGYLLKDNSRPTITKIRVIARNQQLLRIDYEKAHEINKEDEQKITSEIKKLMMKTDIVVISDYGKGIITKDIIENTVKFAKKENKYVIVDPKPIHREYYYGCNLITPNYEEACKLSMLYEDKWKNVVAVGKALIRKYNSDVLITRGEKGMSLFKKDGKDEHIATKAKEVYDVTGAGDSVVATLSLALAVGASLEEAAIIANHAAGIVVAKVGTAVVTDDELKYNIMKDGKDDGIVDEK